MCPSKQWNTCLNNEIHERIIIYTNIFSPQMPQPKSKGKKIVTSEEGLLPE
jgi:hypothetical protein